MIRLIVAIACACLVAGGAFSRDAGQWTKADPAIREWYQSLKQPDAPQTSCCGEADAYWCDDWYVRDGSTYCKITDDRADAPLKRQHVPVGTEILIPRHKLKYDQGNPTGHTIVFLNVVVSDMEQTSPYYGVYCFVLGTLI